MQEFAMAPAGERHNKVMTACPPHVRKNWLLGCARRERHEARQQSVATVTEALSKAPLFVFTEEGEAWMQRSTTDMSPEDLAAAQSAWKEADGLELADDDDEEHNKDEGTAAEDGPCRPGAAPSDQAASGTDRLCHPSADARDRAAGGEDSDLTISVRKKMDQHMRFRLKWSHPELHDALRVVGLAVPGQPSLLNYFRALHSQFGNSQNGFLPQSFHIHTKANIQSMLRCLSRTGVKLGGKLSDKKNVLADRLAFWLNQVVEAGREVHRGELDGEELSGPDDDELCAGKKLQNRYLLPETREIGEVPPDAVVTPEQAESALGHAQATEFDEDGLELLDQELREEEEALAGRQVNPNGIDYSLLAYEPSEGQAVQRFGWDEALGLPRPLTLGDFAFSAQDIQTRVREQLDVLHASYNAKLSQVADADLDTLDPTQLLAYALVAEWSRARVSWLERQSLAAPPRLRMVLLGTAGAGKTHTAKRAITKARQTFGSFASVLIVAFSGVAAANIGEGARTLDAVFHTNTDTAAEDLSGEALDRLIEMLMPVQLLVIDEVSTLGAAAFEIVCRRLEQVGKVLWRKRHGRPPPDSLGGFGGIGVLLIGDFAQLPPVLSSSLLAQAPLQDGRSGSLRSLALAGRQTFQTFEQIVRLRRAHRLPGADRYKESTQRLRDAAMTVEDRELWKTHELQSLDSDASLSLWQGADGLLNDALVLVTDNAQAGRVNGKRLTAGVSYLSKPVPHAPGVASATKPGRRGTTLEPGDASTDQIVVRCCARHSHDKARHADAREFRNLRTATHLRVGAKVILTTNRLWATDTVPLGLMNGARGIVVAILFAPPGSQRRDGLDLAGVGLPHSDGVCLPRSLEQCPLPDVVIVHFPGYKGQPLLPGLPATWVPVPCIEQQSKKKRSIIRVGVPLKLAWALTIHKAQGITEPNGVVVSFEGSRMVRAVSRMGLAFVAWTRVTSWDRMAFVALPPIEDFLAARFSNEFRAREAFESWADQCHDALLVARGIDEGEHIQHHQRHLQASLRARLKRDATQEELDDVKQMLLCRGVAPVFDSVLRSGTGKRDGEAGGGLWSIVASFRAAKQAVGGESSKRGGRVGRGKRPGGAGGSSATDVIKSILREHGYDEERARQAIEFHGVDLDQCVEFCLQSTDADLAATQAVATEDDWASHVIQSLGFDEITCTRALETCEFSFSRALRLLLLGNDIGKANQVGTTHFRRHTTTRVYGIPEQTLAADPVRSAYEERARRELDVRSRAVDLGQYAGATTGACFWLALAAGLAHARWEVPGQALPALAELPALLSKVRETPLSDLDLKTASASLRASAVGQLALLLRQYMCNGPDEILLREDVLRMIFPAFAALDSQSDRRQLQHYKAWVKKLASKEYADELVVLATAQSLQVEIVCVPFTPASASDPWAIASYNSSTEARLPRVLLGNNDVHYMWLAVDHGP